MIGEFIKILADEPEKIQKIFLGGIKIIFSIVIGSILYKWMIGPFKVISLTEYEQLAQFIISGRILIVLLFYFISQYVIIPTANLLPQLIIYILSKWKLKIDNRDLNKIISSFDIIRYSKENEIASPGKNIDILYSLATLFEKEETKTEVMILKNSFIENIWNLYFLFFMLYFFLSPIKSHNNLLTGTILVVLLLIALTYVLMNSFIDFLHSNYKEIKEGLSYIKVNDQILKALKSYYISLEKVEGEPVLSKFKYFSYGKKEYIIIHPFVKRKVLLKDVRNLIANTQKPNRVYLLIVPKDFVENTYTILFENHDSLITIEYTDEKNLEAQLKQTLDTITQ